jgi:hypothetical protein
MNESSQHTCCRRATVIKPKDKKKMFMLKTSGKACKILRILTDLQMSQPKKSEKQKHFQKNARNEEQSRASALEAVLIDLISMAKAAAKKQMCEKTWKIVFLFSAVLRRND